LSVVPESWRWISPTALHREMQVLPKGSAWQGHTAATSVDRVPAYAHKTACSNVVAASEVAVALGLGGLHSGRWSRMASPPRVPHPTVNKGISVDRIWRCPRTRKPRRRGGGGRNGTGRHGRVPAMVAESLGCLSRSIRGPLPAHVDELQLLWDHPPQSPHGVA
jgi:hypothetical protein